MKGLGSDLRHALKIYARTPLSTALAVGALAAAMAFLSVFASMWNDLALRPHPGFASSERIVTLQLEMPERAQGLDWDALQALDEQAVTLAGVVGIVQQTDSLLVDGNQVQARLELVSRGYFSLLRPRLHLGRALTDADHAGDAEPVAVVSYRFWQGQLGGRREALGDVVELSGNSVMVFSDDGSRSSAAGGNVAVRIVGVMHPAMAASFGGARDTDLWLAVEPAAERMRQTSELIVPRHHSTLARLSAGASQQAARNELNSRFSDLAEQSNPAGGETRWLVHPRITSNPQADQEVLRQIHLFLAAGALVATVAAVNIGLFMLARAPGRRREVNLRFALGASRRRIARQLLTEAAVLVLGAAGLGLAASLWLSAVLQDLAFLDGAAWREVNTLDWRVLLILLGAVAILTVTSALTPAVGLRQMGIAQNLRQFSAHAGLAQRASGTAQIALAGLLGGVALAFTWQLSQLARADHGFQPDGLVFVSAAFSQTSFFGGSWEEALARRAARRELLLALPEVDAVAFGVPAPAVPGFSMQLRASPPAQPDQSFDVDVVSIDPEFPHLLGMRLISGAMPRADEPLGVLINERFAEAAWGHLDVLGQILPMRAPMLAGINGEPRVVGVLADVVYAHPRERVPPMVFTGSAFFSGMEGMVLRTSATPAEIRAEVDRLIDQGLIEIEIGDVLRLEDAWNALLAADQSRARLSIMAALVAVFLAAFGFYGTQRYPVAAGRREYAILAAVGAGPRSLRRLVLRRGLALGLPGLVLGALLAFIAVVALPHDLIDASINPWAISLVVAGISAVLVLAASLAPAHEAARMKLATVLREE